MDLTLYLITDSTGIGDREFFETVKKVVQAGVTMVQLREKNACSRELYRKALELKKICSEYGVPLIINDRVDIALAADADGVHLGTDDLPVSVAREILGKDKIIGATAKTAALAADAEKCGADYFGIGAFFATDTKPDALIMTKEAIRAVTCSVKIPAVGIGGLTYENMDIIAGSGVCGAAVSSEIMRAADVSETVKKMAEKIKRVKELQR